MARPKTAGFVLAADEGQPFWFLNTVAINKVGAEDSGGRLSIVDLQVPAGFAMVIESVCRPGPVQASL